MAKKPYTESTDAEDAAEEAQSAREAAAETTRKAANSPRKPGPVTMTLGAIGLAPMVAGSVVKDVAKRTRRQILYGKHDVED